MQPTFSWYNSLYTQHKMILTFENTLRQWVIFFNSACAVPSARFFFSFLSSTQDSITCLVLQDLLGEYVTLSDSTHLRGSAAACGDVRGMKRTSSFRTGSLTCFLKSAHWIPIFISSISIVSGFRMDASLPPWPLGTHIPEDRIQSVWLASRHQSNGLSCSFVPQILEARKHYSRPFRNGDIKTD